jgi:LysM domain-containing protein
VSVGGGTTPIRDSIEQPFDLEATMATTHARTPAALRPGMPGGSRVRRDRLGRDRPGHDRPGHDRPGRPHLRLVPATAAAGWPARRAGAPGRPLDGRPEPPLRLTRRGRLVLRGLIALVMLGLMTGAALTMAHRADAADGPARPVVVAHHVVLPGETLWGIATSVAPKADPRDTVARLVEFNALRSSDVHAGQTLAVPPGLPGRR